MIRTEQFHLPVVARTHPGMSGKNNEDRYSVTAYRLRANRATPALLAVLSDGIGGHKAGEVAAEIAVNIINQQVSQSPGGDPTHILQQAIQQASQDIYRRAQGDPDRKGMGATCVVAWIIGSRLYAATVGDSRLYLLRGSSIHQLSTDHTWVQEALERGLLQPDEARGHPNAHVIRRYLGSPTPPEVDFRLRLNGQESDNESEANQGLPLAPGDRLLLCSDGLTDLVDDGEILSAFNALPANEAVQSLIDLANARGGHDNITLVAAEIPAVALPVRVPWTRRIWSLGCLGVVLAALVIAGLVIGGLWFFQGWRFGVIAASATPSSTPGETLPTSAFPTATPVLGASPIPKASPLAGTPLLPGATPTTALPLPAGPTLTPWPTNTPAPFQ